MSNADLIGRLIVAVLLSGIIGLEREFRQKHAGLRTHALVGLGSALIIEVSAYGFSDVLIPGKVVLDPSRVAAQVVSGIGFLGAGLIFVRQDYVRGLTTAASVWLTAAVGLAAGAGMWEVAVASTVLGLVVVEGLELLEARLHPDGDQPMTLRVTYVDGDAGAFNRILSVCDPGGDAKITSVHLEHSEGAPPLVQADIHIRRHHGGATLAHELLAVAGVVDVRLEQSE